MELKKNQYVVFSDGHKEGYLEAQWSEKAQAFYSVITIDVDGYKERKKIYSTDIRTKEARKSGNISKSKMIVIYPDFETEKAFAILTGSNGCITSNNQKDFYTYIAKSICIEKDGKIYAPIWAIK